MSLQLLGFGLSVLEGIDPNPENYVSAGILHVRAAQVGILARLEPNKAAQVRFSKICNFSEILCSLPEHKCSENYCHTPVVSFIVVVCVIDAISVSVILRQKLLLNKKTFNFSYTCTYRLLLFKLGCCRQTMHLLTTLVSKYTVKHLFLQTIYILRYLRGWSCPEYWISQIYMPVACNLHINKVKKQVSHYLKSKWISTFVPGKRIIDSKRPK